MFRTFVERRQGQYYWQDPVSASRMYGDFLAIKEKRDNWQQVAREHRLRWLVLRVSEPAEAMVERRYRDEATVVLRNADWAVLEIHAAR
jgi:hypothetical protein